MRTIPVAKLIIVREKVPDGLQCGRSIRSPRDAVDVLTALIGSDTRECFAVMHLNSKHKILSVERASVGTLNSALVHPREIFRAAIVAGVASVIIGHNHPSGDPEPSVEDDRVTRRLTASGDLLGIPVLDHVVVTDDPEVHYIYSSGKPSMLTVI